MGVSEETLKQKTMEVFNKMDRLENATGKALHVKYATGKLEVTSLPPKRNAFDCWLRDLCQDEPGFHPKRMFVSALEGNGLTVLKQELESIIDHL